MESTVKKLFDYLSMDIPPEMRKWHVTEEEIHGALALLGRDHASQNLVGSAQEGDSLLCRDAGGQTVLLYPGRKLPGAEQAEQAAVGRRVGEAFFCRLAHTDVSLTVAEIRRLEPHPLNDALARQANIPGVSTLAEYRSWYIRETELQKREKAAQIIARTFREGLSEHSELDIDVEEQRHWCSVRGRMLYDTMIANGHDPHIPAEGTELLSDEEALAQIVEDQERFYRDFVIFRHMARQTGYEYTQEIFKKAVDEMLETNKEQIAAMGYDTAQLYTDEAYLLRMENAYAGKAEELLVKAAKQFLED